MKRGISSFPFILDLSDLGPEDEIPEGYEKVTIKEYVGYSAQGYPQNRHRHYAVRKPTEKEADLFEEAFGVRPFEGEEGDP